MLFLMEFRGKELAENMEPGVVNIQAGVQVSVTGFHSTKSTTFKNLHFLEMVATKLKSGERVKCNFLGMRRGQGDEPLHPWKTIPGIHHSI